MRAGACACAGRGWAEDDERPAGGSHDEALAPRGVRLVVRLALLDLAEAELEDLRCGTEKAVA